MLVINRKTSVLANYNYQPFFTAIMEEKFYFVSIEYLCKTEEGEFLPCEIGMVEWSMKNGITKTFHKFIQHGKLKKPACCG